MNPAKTSDKPVQVNRGGSVRNAEKLIYKRIGGALAGLLVFCTVVTRLAAENQPGSAVTESGDLERRAEVYVDRFFPPNPKLNLLKDGRARGQALAHYSIARALEEKKDIDAALSEYREVLRLIPGNVSLAQRVAYLLASSGQKKEARGVLEKALELNVENFRAYLNFSDYLFTYHAETAPDKERAVALAEEALDKFPDEAAVYDHLIRFYLVSRQAGKAKATIERALKRPAPDPYFWLKIATIAQRVWPLKTDEGHEPVLLNGIYQKVLDHSDNRVSIQEAVAGFYHSSHQLKKARELYEKIITEHPDQLEVRKKLALVYQVLDQQDKVIETLRTVIQIDPRDAKTNRTLSEIYREREDPDNAAHYLQQALKISKGSEREYIYLARLLHAAQRPEDAVPVLERAAFYYPKEPEITFLLAISRSRAKQFEAALTAFEQTLELGKEVRPGSLNEEFYFQYGAAAERAGHLEQAAGLFRKSMELLAKSGAEDDKTKAFTAQVYNYLGYMWLENDLHVDEAGELIKTAFNLTPESGAIQDSLGWFYFKKRQFEKARHELTGALAKMKEPDSVVFDHLARTYFELGMKTEAVDHMNKALNLEADNKEFIDRLKKFETEEPPVQRPLPNSKPSSEKKNKAAPKASPPPSSTPSPKKAA